MSGLGDHGHFTGRLAGTDDPQELRLVALVPADGAQASGAHVMQVEHVDDVTYAALADRIAACNQAVAA